jgi:hypothetical protein
LKKFTIISHFIEKHIFASDCMRPRSLFTQRFHQAGWFADGFQLPCLRKLGERHRSAGLNFPLAIHFYENNHHRRETTQVGDGSRNGTAEVSRFSMKKQSHGGAAGE